MIPRIWIGLMALAFLSACGRPSHESILAGYNPKVDPGILTNPDFAIIQRIFQANRCMNCHTVAAGNEGDINLETYSNVKAVAVLVRDAVNSDFMPMGRVKMSQPDKDVINLWVNNGAPEFVE